MWKGVLVDEMYPTAGVPSDTSLKGGAPNRRTRTYNRVAAWFAYAAMRLAEINATQVVQDQLAGGSVQLAVWSKALCSLAHFVVVCFSSPLRVCTLLLSFLLTRPPPPFLLCRARARQRRLRLKPRLADGRAQRALLHRADARQGARVSHEAPVQGERLRP